MNRKGTTFLLLLIHLNLWGQVDSLSLPHSIEERLKEYKLDEVTVSGYTPTLSNSKNGTYSLKFENLEQVPQFFGTVDAIRSLQLMSGIQTTGDIASGLYVQGCEPSHNLFLLDNAPIYNPSHLLGFIPALSTNHMENISIDKGYISASDGGRLAAVVKCYSKEEVGEKSEVSGEINILSTALTVNTPTGDKGNVIISARACYANAMINLVEKVIKDDLPFRYNQYDFNGTWHYRPTKSDKIYISSYYGSDKVALSIGDLLSGGECKWQNGLLSAGWEHKFSEKSTLSTSIYNTIYKDRTILDQDIIRFNLKSNINDFGARIDHKLVLNNYFTLNYGGDLSYRTVNPQVTKLTGLSTAFDTPKQPTIKNSELGLWSELEYEPLEDIKTTLGLRYGGVLSQSYALEPRAKVDYSITNNLTTTCSYSRQYQYINQVIVSGAGLPVNYYVPCTSNSPAQRSDNISIEANYKSPQRKWSITVLGYYKWLKNQYENISSLTTIFIEDTQIYNRFTISQGNNYGLEAMVRYNLGKFSGWCSYTLSWAKRQSNYLNDGKSFYANNDRRHDLSLVGTWAINSHWRLSGNFVLASGTPFTQSKGLMIMGEQPISYYSNRNEGQMPTYTRLDLTINKKLKIKWFKESSLNFGIYNIYARHNSLYFHYKLLSEDGKLEIIDRGNAIFSILPSFGLTFKM